MDARKNLQLAVAEGLLADINEILIATPALLNQKDEQGTTILFDAAIAGKFEVVDYLINHKAYQTLKIQEKCELLRDVIDAGIKLVQESYLKGETEKTTALLEKIFFYNKKIIDKDDEDYTVFAYALSLLASVQMKGNQWFKAFGALQEAIFIQKKVKQKTDHDYRRLVFCLNALAKYQLKERMLDEAIKSLTDAVYYCQMISSENKTKAPLLAILKGNLAVIYRASLASEVKLWGFEGKSLTRDSDSSLVYSIIDQLDSQNLLANSFFTLAYFQNLSASHRERFAAHYTGDLGNKDLHAYLTKLIQSGIWNMEHVLLALAFSRALNVNLVIIRCDAEAPIVLKQGEALTTLYLGIEPGQVYQSLRLRPDRSPVRALQEYIDASVVDNFYKNAYELGPSEVFLENSSLMQKKKTTAVNKRSLEVPISVIHQDQNKRLKFQKERREKRGHSLLSEGYSSEGDASKHFKLFSSGNPLIIRLRPETSSETSLKQDNKLTQGLKL